MKIKELLSEGMYVVKSKDGVEKRFKDANSPEAKAWKESTRKKPSVKFPKYGKTYWERKEDDPEYEGKLPWSKITIDDLVGVHDMIKDQVGMDADDWSITSRAEKDVDGVPTAFAVLRVFGLYDKRDMGLSIEDGEPETVEEVVNIRVHRDTKQPEKLVFAGFA